MEMITRLEDFPSRCYGGVVCIGNFDGVHLGHRAVLSQAKQFGLPVIVLLFAPHPRRYFNPSMPWFQLSSLNTRAKLLHEAGADVVLALPFDEAMANRSPQEFVQDVLCTQLRAKAVAVGYDFHFGKARAGTPAVLQELGAQAGLQVHIQQAVQADKNAPPFSSSAIRHALQAGQPEIAAQQLGRWWWIEGTVQKGDQRGREWGFPTANIALGEYQPPAFGIYAVVAQRLAPEPFAAPVFGVANLGIRPNFRLQEPLLEVFLFDFDTTIYDHTLAVAPLGFLREEQKFDSTDALIAQMTKDADQARQLAPQLLGKHPFILPS